MSKRGESLAELVELMQTLLGPNGCPWDREQTLESLRQYVIEEAHEVVDAIDGGNPEMLREELGDLLLQVVFHFFADAICFSCNASQVGQSRDQLPVQLRQQLCS